MRVMEGGVVVFQDSDGSGLGLQGKLQASPWQLALSLFGLGGRHALHTLPSPAAVGFFKGNHGNTFVSEAQPRLPLVSLSSRGWEGFFASNG